MTIGSTTTDVPQDLGALTQSLRDDYSEVLTVFSLSLHLPLFVPSN